MTQTPAPEQNSSVDPSRRDRLRPLELLLLSGILGVFAGGIVLFTTRNWVLTGIFLGIGFIVSLVFMALLGLGGKPSAEDDEARKDLQGPAGGDKNWH